MSTPTSQKALALVSKFGEFIIQNFPVPRPGPGQILVKIKSTSINPIDWKIQKYGFFIEEFPAILGCDIAGDIEVVGEGVTQWAKGDRVFFEATFKNEEASFQQYTIGNAVTAARIPDNISYDQAASIPATLTCAYIGLFNKEPHGLGFEAPTTVAGKGTYSDTPLVVLGGPSSVGQYAIQLAKLVGFSPVITTAAAKHNNYLKSLGADYVLDRNLSTPALSVEISKLTDKPIKAVYDAISSKETQQMGHDILASGGKLCIVVNPAVNVAEDKKLVFVIGILNLPHNIGLLTDMYTALSQWVEAGLIKPNKVEVLPGGLAGIKEGLKMLENDQVSGLKLVAHPQETL
ncbi:chaperonin 10-like protein [Crucibulum laeve]|uniref:Chaperonin 10-like protein n=1 Tax=Crucibulum laeve TaxID=68775 RepID=A0A5C3LHA8_9AGAR|nr:chaperonin 10-like protein [Crucibulum laeve]